MIKKLQFFVTLQASIVQNFFQRLSTVFNTFYYSPILLFTIFSTLFQQFFNAFLAVFQQFSNTQIQNQLLGVGPVYQQNELSVLGARSYSSITCFSHKKSSLLLVLVASRKAKAAKQHMQGEGGTGLYVSIFSMTVNG